MSFDPDDLTLFQKVLLEHYPATNDPFRRFAGPIDRAEAVAAGAVVDPVLDDLLDRLGHECGTVDEASAAVRAMSDEVERRAIAARGTDRWEAQCVLMGALRTVAAELWRADGERRLNLR